MRRETIPTITGALNAGLQVDEIIVGISEERQAFHRAGPLRRWIRWRHKLWRDVCRRAKGGVIESREILLYCSRSLYIHTDLYRGPCPSLTNKVAVRFSLHFPCERGKASLLEGKNSLLCRIGKMSPED